MLNEVVIRTRLKKYCAVLYFLIALLWCILRMNQQKRTILKVLHSGAMVIFKFCGALLQLCVAIEDWLCLCLDGLLIFVLSPTEQQIDDFFRR